MGKQSDKIGSTLNYASFERENLEYSLFALEPDYEKYNYHHNDSKNCSNDDRNCIYKQDDKAKWIYADVRGSLCVASGNDISIKYNFIDLVLKLKAFGHFKKR